MSWKGFDEMFDQEVGLKLHFRRGRGKYAMCQRNERICNTIGWSEKVSLAVFPARSFRSVTHQTKPETMKVYNRSAISLTHAFLRCPAWRYPDEVLNVAFTVLGSLRISRRPWLDRELRLSSPKPILDMGKPQLATTN